MKALGVLISILWAFSGILLIFNKQFFAEMIVIGVLAVVALFLTCRRKDLIKSQCHCVFGGLIICAVLLFIQSRKELSFDNVLSTLAVAGLISLPLIISDSSSRTSILRFWGESGTPFAPAGGGPEGLASGCLVFIILWALRLFIAFALGFLCTVALFFWSLQELFSNTALPFKKVIANVPSVSQKPEKCNSEAEKVKKISENKQTNKTIHWL